MAKNNAPRRSRSGSPLYWSAESWAFLSLRLYLSILFINAGLNKFNGPDGFGFGAYYSSTAKGLIDAVGPHFGYFKFLVYPFAYSIGYVEVLLGFALLLGVKTKISLAVSALTFVALSLGLLLMNSDKSSTMPIYLLITSAALYFVRHNKLELLR